MQKSLRVVRILLLSGVLLCAPVSHAQIGMQPAQVQAYGDYMALVVKLNDLYSKYCGNVDTTTALPQMLQKCKALAAVLEAGDAAQDKGRP